MTDEATDPLFETAEPALSNRLARFRHRMQQSSVDHAAQSLIMALEDVNDAIQLAKTRDELSQLRETVETAIASLITSAAVASTLDHFWTGQ